MKIHNFSSGPAILPQSVMEQAAQAVLDFNGMGLSILEISHRSPEFIAVLEETVSLVRELGQIDDRYEVLFLQGGASTQFFMTAMNLLNEDETAGYVDTGSWSSKAIKEAKAFGQIEVLASSKDKNYTYIPSAYEIPTHLKYLHLTSNNTIFGTQFHAWPETSVPFVCDMSSDIFSRPFPIDRFGLIYAGAQKNMGPAGFTLVIIRKDLMGTVRRYMPTMLNYQVHADNESCYNTPPVYAIYIGMLTLKWMKAQGGLTAMARHNEAKAQVLYAEIDANPLFVGTTVAEDRSLMNATFVMNEGYESLEKDFLKACDEAGCSGVKGHRSVGGFRASIYNAMPLESVQVLVDVMRSFAAQRG